MSKDLKQYEIMLLISSDLSEAGAKEEIDTFKSTLAKQKGEVNFEDFWGKRKLAYLIQKQDMGYYHVMLFTYPSDQLSTLKNDLELNKSFLRYLITIPPKEYQPITSGEIEASEEKYMIELAAKKAGKKKKPTVAPTSTPEKPKVHKEIEKTSTDSAEERAKKLDKILSEDLNI